MRIGNCSGFYGDRLAAMREMLDGGEVDVLTGDYLAELTMLILFRSRAKDPAKGYATTFLRQLEDCLGTAVERGVRIVANAGGLNPAGCAAAIRVLAERLGVPTRVAHVEGDDLLPRLGSLQEQGETLTNLDTGQPLASSGLAPVTANAYLGAWGIVEALRAGADVVVTGRVTDASLTVGPAAWFHAWTRDDWDRLAGAVVAGHVLECGAQATGGNYAFFREVPGLEHVGFPLAEVAEDGSAVITKHPGTGGLVSVGTVTAQLLYEIGGPAYLGPDVVTHLDTVRLEQQAPDRVRLSAVRGSPPPPTTKVCINTLGGVRNEMTFLLTGRDVEEKAALVRRQLEPLLGGVRSVDWVLGPTAVDDPPTNAQATATLRVVVKDTEAARIGRSFSAAAVELALASYPGCTLTAPPGEASPYGVYWPALVPNGEVAQVAVLPDGSRVTVAPAAVTEAEPPVLGAGEAEPPAGQPAGPTRRLPLGTVFGARSGDKGGTANVGVWARDEAGYAWLRDHLTEKDLPELLPEVTGEAQRHLLPNLNAVNFVLPGFLGEGVSSGVRADPQAKGLGEWLRARYADLPVALLAETDR